MKRLVSERVIPRQVGHGGLWTGEMGDQEKIKGESNRKQEEKGGW